MTAALGDARRALRQASEAEAAAQRDYRSAVARWLAHPHCPQVGTPGADGAEVSVRDRDEWVARHCRPEKTAHEAATAARQAARGHRDTLRLQHPSAQRDGTA